MSDMTVLDLFKVFRTSVNPELPVLAARVFALRDKHYNGCGFHYGMEKSLGKVIAYVNDMEGMKDLGVQMVMEVVYAHLLEQVAAAEKSAAEPNDLDGEEELEA